MTNDAIFNKRASLFSPRHYLNKFWAPLVCRCVSSEYVGGGTFLREDFTWTVFSADKENSFSFRLRICWCLGVRKWIRKKYTQRYREFLQIVFKEVAGGYDGCDWGEWKAVWVQFFFSVNYLHFIHIYAPIIEFRVSSKEYAFYLHIFFFL